MEALHHYRAYGLAVASELALPELDPDAAPPETPDLRVRLGDTPERIEDPVEERVLWAAKPGAWLHDVPRVGRYFIHREGSEVVIERRGGSDADLRAFLFGLVLGALFHQRGQFVLHAGSVALPGGAVALAGHSGVGKSTTLTELGRRGHGLLGDDKLVVAFDADGAPSVVPGYPTLRLWRDAVEHFGDDPAAHPVLREGFDKHLYAAPRFEPSPTPLRTIAVLHKRRIEDDHGIVTTPIEGYAAVRAVLTQTYRRRIVRGLGREADYLQWATRLAARVPVVRLSRPPSTPVSDVADAVEALLGEA